MKTLPAMAAAGAAAIAPSYAQQPASPAPQATKSTTATAAAVDPAQKEAIEAAVKAADAWLALMDGGQAGAAWEQGAALLQKAVGRSGWLDVGRTVRAPLGAVKERKVTAAAYTRDFPGAPPGEYVLIRYATDFATRSGAVETVVPMRQRDGSWKVATYRVQ